MELRAVARWTVASRLRAPLTSPQRRRRGGGGGLGLRPLAREVRAAAGRGEPLLRQSSGGARRRRVRDRGHDPGDGGGAPGALPRGLGRSAGRGLGGVARRGRHGHRGHPARGPLAPFDRVIFQFPQHPERRKIHRHRELLRRFFASVLPHVAEGGEVLVTLCGGQGGTPAEREPRKASDTWQVQDAAAEAGLVLAAVHAFPAAALASLGYSSTGYRGSGLRASNSGLHQDRPFCVDGGLTHAFRAEGAGAVAAFPLCWSHDVSFWARTGFEEADLLCALRHAGGGGPLEVTAELLDEYHRPEDFRAARTYRLSVCARDRAVSQKAWRHWCESARAEMERQAEADAGAPSAGPGPPSACEATAAAAAAACKKWRHLGGKACDFEPAHLVLGECQVTL
ncbi:unnamed protein product [Prorocentrum cordatum]|uniref:25S rRNA (uridine-N(3))-methyltransferase BMT5-like domain-containing protein n=1 Tax=Prorocentrum cordatum TaxID=2364126 RepID=A0ABN9WLD8_9DINO|nr:unnamed protein product [Polarella glacialis]